MYTPYEEGGIAGPNAKQALMQALQGSGGTAAPIQAPPMQAETPAAPVGDFSRLTGYDKGKYDANKNDAKYQMAHVLSQYDPRQGITPEVLAGLNGLGYGNFSGSGQKLNLSGLTDAGRAVNLQGDYNGADFIQGFSGGNGKWQYADPVEEAKQAQAAPAPGGGGMPSFAGSNINGMLQSDAMGNIQQALSGLQQPGMLQQLIAALSGGQ